ncbi:helix-turn-helix domain-containing protein [Sphingobium sp.]|uniref:helix-turn-helix domain-containing protein n=1 Tax=Sphingobium sp. TaxID=1912891 RepID=UPI000DAF530E|nr:helix-turn-helix domain-containing protein [Sphingobium sp.]PZU62717.1 MAG: helix-turn-helix domain-containing protein [Sphingobium sp.]
MGTFTLGAALTLALQPSAGLAKRQARSGALHRTGARVLRDSVEAGTFEHAFFTPPGKGETDRLLRAARKALDAGRRLRREARAGIRALTPIERGIATLTSASVRIFEEILTLSRLNRGRIFPSYDYLAEATGLGRATVARGLKILEDVGFVMRQRRFKRIEDAQGPGPRYEQTSNAYRTMLPQAIVAYLPRWMRPAPVSDDMLQRRIDAAQDIADMRGSLPCKELAGTIADGALGKVLARLGAALDRQERESQKNPQPLSESSYKGSVPAEGGMTP